MKLAARRAVTPCASLSRKSNSLNFQPESLEFENSIMGTLMPIIVFLPKTF